MPLSPNIRQDFPSLCRLHANGKPWVYLDSAATTLKPRSVIEAITHAMTYHSTNVHRSVYGLGDETTELFEGSRKRIARFLGAQAHEIVFVRNATEALNLVARCYPRHGVTLVSWGEHHSNLLPWRDGQFLGIAPLPDGSPDLDAISNELKKGNVSILSIAHVNNVTGFQANIRELASLVHRYHGLLVVDAAQSAGRVPIDVTDLECDFLACSSHKMYGPSGIGILYGKSERLHQLRPYITGGGTVDSLTEEKCDWRSIPWRFEGGTPPIEAAIGLGAAVDYLQGIGMDEIAEYEKTLVCYAMQQFQNCSFFRPISRSVSSTSGIISFHFGKESSHVVARTLSDRYGICLRSGYHCAQPLHDCLNLTPTLRVSFGIYNTKDDIDRCAAALQEITRILPAFS